MKKVLIAAVTAVAFTAIAPASPALPRRLPDYQGWVAAQKAGAA